MQIKKDYTREQIVEICLFSSFVLYFYVFMGTEHSMLVVRDIP